MRYTTPSRVRQTTIASRKTTISPNISRQTAATTASNVLLNKTRKQRIRMRTTTRIYTTPSRTILKNKADILPNINSNNTLISISSRVKGMETTERAVTTTLKFTTIHEGENIVHRIGRIDDDLDDF